MQTFELKRERKEAEVVGLELGALASRLNFLIIPYCQQRHSFKSPIKLEKKLGR